MPRVKDLTGEVYGRLTVLHREPRKPGDRYKGARWVCQCACGTVKSIPSNSLRRPKPWTPVTSCGCLAKDILVARLQTHRMSDTSLYRRWNGLRQRCENPRNPDYASYGGRGIRVCPEWISFEEFARWALNAGYDESLTIDRIDNDKGYSPDNCRWVSIRDNCNNTSRTPKYDFFGERMTIPDAARKFDCSYAALYDRIRRKGQSPETSVSKILARRGREPDRLQHS
jgi:hypothetical protein